MTLNNLKAENTIAEKEKSGRVKVLYQEALLGSGLVIGTIV